MLVVCTDKKVTLHILFIELLFRQSTFSFQSILKYTLNVSNLYIWIVIEY